MSKSSTSRRTFIKKTTLGAAGLAVGLNAKAYNRILGANDRIQTAIFGCYRRFGGIAPALTKLDNVDITYVCDVDSRRQEEAVGKVKEWAGTAPKGEKDLRKILDAADVDAVFHATPDHWHAPGTWMSVDAGKHVYVEKPCSHNPREGEILIALHNATDRVIQMGNQQRSATKSQEIMSEIHNGVIGHPYRAVAFYSNSRGRVPNANRVAAPDYLDWELFQGPAPRQPYVDILGDYNWHWFWHWGTGETGNNATHELDVARWALQVTYPREVQVQAAKRHFIDDPWTMYDTMDATFIFPGEKVIKWDGKSRNGYHTYDSDRGTIIYGTEGSVFVNRNGYKLYDRAGKLVKEGKSGGQEAGTALGGGGDTTDAHIHNFLETIRGKAKLNAPIDEGAISTQLCHYANISYRMGNKALEIDPTTGRFTKKKVMKKFWSREYEKGWEPPKV